VVKLERFIVIFLEDPGAVVFLEPYLSHLRTKGVYFCLLTSGYAEYALQEYGSISVNTASDFNMLLRKAACVVIGTSENRSSPAFQIVRTARSLFVPSIGAVDAWVNAEFRFAGDTRNPLEYAPDWLIVPNTRTAKRFEELGFPKTKIYTVGHPCREIVASKSRPPYSGERDALLVFISEVSSGLGNEQYMYNKSYTLKGREVSLRRTNIVAEEFLEATYSLRASGLRLKTVLRLHPKECLEDLGHIAEEFDEISAGADPINLLKKSDLAIGMTSMLLTQAYLLGVPTLSILPRVEERDWLDETADGSIPVVCRRSEIVPAINRVLYGQPGALSAKINDMSSSVDRIGNAILSICTRF
jgi:hypothetical protein